MKTILYISILSLNVFALFNCNKTEGINITKKPVTYNYEKYLEVKWKNKGVNNFLSYNILLEENMVYFSYIDVGNEKYVYNLITFNRENGDSLWYWNEEVSFAQCYQIMNNTLYFYGQLDHHIYGVDVLSGKTVFNFHPNGAKTMAIHGLKNVGGKLYISYYYGEKGNYDDSCYIYSIDPISTNYFHEYTLYTSERDNFRPGLSYPNFYFAPNGDTILLYQSPSLNWSNNHHRGEYFAINLTQDNMYFDFKDTLHEVGIGGNPIIENNIAYISGGWEKNAAIDLGTKEIIWMASLPEKDFTGSGDFIIYNNQIIFNAGNKGIVNSIDKYSGEQLWTNHKVGKEGSDLYEYHGKLYFTSIAGLVCLDANTGETLWIVDPIELTGEKDQMFNQSIAIDQETGYLYASTYSYFYCLKIKE